MGKNSSNCRYYVPLRCTSVKSERQIVFNQVSAAADGWREKLYREHSCRNILLFPRNSLLFMFPETCALQWQQANEAIVPAYPISLPTCHLLVMGCQYLGLFKFLLFFLVDWAVVFCEIYRSQIINNRWGNSKIEHKTSAFRHQLPPIYGESR